MSMRIEADREFVQEILCISRLKEYVFPTAMDEPTVNGGIQPKMLQVTNIDLGAATQSPIGDVEPVLVTEKTELACRDCSSLQNQIMPFPLPCLPGEIIKSAFVYVKGVVALTNYRVVIFSSRSASAFNRFPPQIILQENNCSSQDNQQEFISSPELHPFPSEHNNQLDNDRWLETHSIATVYSQLIPLRMIWKGEIVELMHYQITTKSGRVMKIYFHDPALCARWHELMKQEVFLPVSVSNLFAFTFRSSVLQKFPLEEDKFHQLFFQDSNSTPADEEFKRMKFPIDLWQINDVNEKFSVCQTYPVQNIVPRSCTDDDIREMSKFRQLNRFPIVVWRSQTTGAVLLRCSQPCVGIIGSRNRKDEDFLSAVLNCCQKDPQASVFAAEPSTLAPSSSALGLSKRLLIVDARHYSSAFYNCFRGGGFENVQHYPNVDIEWKNLPNMHSVRASFEKLNVCIHTAPDLWLSSLESSEWLTYLSQLLHVSHDIAQVLHTKGCPVMVHCTDGWDRTPQLTSLVQLLLDPFYRTIKGFRILIDREWLDYGHKFAERCGIDKLDVNQISPIFLQFLDCVHQLCNQFPCEFEFNQIFLIKLGHHAYSTLFGTFLCNSQSERLEHEISKNTCSIWSYLQPQFNAHIKNYLYQQCREVLTPSWSPRDLVLWRGMYFDDVSWTKDPNKDITSPATSPSEHLSPLGVHSTNKRNAGSHAAAGSTTELDHKQIEPGDIISSVGTSPFPSLNDNSIMTRSLSLPSIETLAQLRQTRMCEIGRSDSPLNTAHLASTEGEIIGKMNGSSEDLKFAHHPPQPKTRTRRQEAPPSPKPRSTKPGPPITVSNPPNEQQQETAPDHFNDDCGSSSSQTSDSCSFSDSQFPASMKMEQLGDWREFFTWFEASCQEADSSLHVGSALGKDYYLFQPWKLVPSHDWDGLVTVSSNVDPYAFYIVQMEERHLFERKQLQLTQKRYREDAHKILLQLKQYKDMGITVNYDDIDESLIDPCRQTHGLHHSVPPSWQSNDTSIGSSFEEVQKIELVMWIPDHWVTKCGLCLQTFSTVLRRHHCRICGHIFCNTCSNYFVPIPKQNLATPTRVCRDCYSKLQLEGVSVCASKLIVS